MKTRLKTLQGIDFVKRGDVDYFPTIALRETPRTANPEDYDNPIKALKQYAEDVSAARALAARFDVDVRDLRPPENVKTDITRKESRVNVVIEAIEKEAKKQGSL